MRQQLIQWLIEDIIPEAQRSHDAEGAILKFASANNLAPAQVEALGQLFNTAKTLSHLEKSANRGASFPILDVPQMVGKYLEAPMVQHKEAPADGKAASLSLPQCLAGWQTLGMEPEQEVKIASAEPQGPVSVFERERADKAKRHSFNVAVKNMELAKQAHVDILEEGRAVMEDIHRALRSDSDLNFPDIERDALSLHGIESTPVFDKLAAYLKSRNWKVKRGSFDDRKRLIPDYGNVMAKISNLVDLHFLAVAADEHVKEATALAAAPQTDIAPPVAPESSPAPADKPRNMGGGNNGAASGGSKKNDNGKSVSGKPAAGKSESGSFFGGVNKVMDAGAGKGYSLLEPVVLSALSNKNNVGQRTVDNDHRDAKHLATLQRLMMTDEVLADADPDKIVSVYNTIREIAPNLAGDANVMRVALRSAVQHDGISPFDIKSFLDTEAARQKTDYNRDLQDALRYKGQEMGNRPA